MLGMHGSVPSLCTCHHPDTGRQRRRPTDIIPCKASREKFSPILYAQSLQQSGPRLDIHGIIRSFKPYKWPYNWGYNSSNWSYNPILITGRGPFLKQTFQYLHVVKVSIQHRTGTTIPHWEILVTHFGVSSASILWGVGKKGFQWEHNIDQNKKTKKQAESIRISIPNLWDFFWFSDFAKKRTSRWFKGPRLTRLLQRSTWQGMT